MPNMIRPCYAMAQRDNDSAEITMYGEIVESVPTDWWTGEPVEGQYIVEKEFLDDLKSISGCKTITIRMNSLGGDAGVSILIHNRLRELAAKGTSLICIVDGVAMSGGSLIMCACDTVRVNPSSLVMIHKSWTFLFGGYNADDMRQQASENDAWDKAQVSIYKRKCGLSDTVITHMMAETSYMTGREAVDKGFADELLEDAEPLNIAASADGRSLFVRGTRMHLAAGMHMPDGIPMVTPDESSVETNKSPANAGSNKGGNPMTLEEFKAQNPDLAKQLTEEAHAEASAAADATQSSAALAERQRISDIDNVACLFDDETVRDAKYGEHPCTAQEMTYRAAVSNAKKGKKYLADAQDDYKASGAADVTAAHADDGDDKPMTNEQKLAQGQADAKRLSKKEE